MKRGAPLNPFAVRFHEPGALPYRFGGGESARTLWRRFVEAGRRGEIVGPHGTGKTTLLRTLEPVARATGEEIRVVTLHDGDRWPKELLVPWTCKRPERQDTLNASACPWADFSGARPPTAQTAAQSMAPGLPGPQTPSPAQVGQPFQADQTIGDRAAVRRSGQAGKPDLRTLFLDGAEQLAPVVWHALRIWACATRSGLLVTTHRPLGLPMLHAAAVDRESALWVTRAVLAQSPEAPRLVSDESVPDLLAACQGNLREVLFRMYDTYEERWSART